MRTNKNPLQSIGGIKEKIKILLYNKFFDFEYPEDLQFKYPDAFFFFDKQYIDDAEIVVFHIPSLELSSSELKNITKKKGQLWVYWSFECGIHLPDFQTHEIKALFDLTATYELDADIPLPYIVDFKHEDWEQPPEEKTEMINAFFSSSFNKSGRYQYLAEIMDILDVHSYGSVLNNRPNFDDPYSKIDSEIDSVLDGIGYKKQIISKYKFTLAFENAIAKDYVTEKFFQPLILGSVPIYLGAPNVEDFAPGDNCYINVSSFPSVEELANYLRFLNDNDDEYNKFLHWKKLPLRERFKSKLTLSDSIFEMLPRVIKEIRAKS